MELPLFPLHLVLYPGRMLPLHVFEQRYQQLLADCRAGDGRFGVVAIRSGREAHDVPEVHEVGTIAEIQSVTELGDGRADVITRGRARFRIDELLPPDPYMRARVTPLDEAAGRVDTDLAEEVRDLLVPYLASLGAPSELLCHLPEQPAQLAYLAAAALHVDVREQQRLLELDACADRLALALRMLRRETGLMRHLGAVGSLRPPGPNGPDLN